MLSREEKEELLRDARSPKRRTEFAQSRKVGLEGSRSLDEFIRFLTAVQKIFSPFMVSKKVTAAQFNKL